MVLAGGAGYDVLLAIRKEGARSLLIEATVIVRELEDSLSVTTLRGDRSSLFCCCCCLLARWKASSTEGTGTYTLGYKCEEEEEVSFWWHFRAAGGEAAGSS